MMKTEQTEQLIKMAQASYQAVMGNLYESWKDLYVSARTEAGHQHEAEGYAWQIRELLAFVESSYIFPEDSDWEEFDEDIEPDQQLENIIKLTGSFDKIVEKVIGLEKPEKHFAEDEDELESGFLDPRTIVAEILA